MSERHVIRGVLRPTEIAFPITLDTTSGYSSDALDDVASAKADLDAAAAQYTQYRKRYKQAIREALATHTQAEIASRVGVSQVAISRLLSR